MNVESRKNICNKRKSQIQMMDSVKVEKSKRLTNLLVKTEDFLVLGAVITMLKEKMNEKRYWFRGGRMWRRREIGMEWGKGR